MSYAKLTKRKHWAENYGYLSSA